MKQGNNTLIYHISYSAICSASTPSQQLEQQQLFFVVFVLAPQHVLSPEIYSPAESRNQQLHAFVLPHAHVP
jgi:hypothetical protein